MGPASKWIQSGLVGNKALIWRVGRESLSQTISKTNILHPFSAAKFREHLACARDLMCTHTHAYTHMCTHVHSEDTHTCTLCVCTPLQCIPESGTMSGDRTQLCLLTGTHSKHIRGHMWGPEVSVTTVTHFERVSGALGVHTWDHCERESSCF